MTRKGGGFLHNLPEAPAPQEAAKPSALRGRAPATVAIPCGKCGRAVQSIEGVMEVTCGRCLLILGRDVPARKMSPEQERQANRLEWRKRRAEQRARKGKP